MKHACTQTSSRYSTYHPMHPVKNFSRPSGSLLRNLNQVTIVQVPYHLVSIYIYIYIHLKAIELSYYNPETIFFTVNMYKHIHLV